MSDIFISYASEDRPRAATIAKALAAEGWSVWWDRKIPLGRRFADVIQEEIAKSRCVVVLWSEKSVKKDWVIEEAQDAKDRGILVPVFVERAQPPWGFRLLQAGDLAGWAGDSADSVFRTLCQDISALLGPASKPVPVAGKPPVEDRRPGEEATNPDDGLKYVWVPPGEFQMGCSPGDGECFDDEKPPHTVTIPRGFWLGQTAVTVGAYKRFAERTGVSMPAEPVIGERELNPRWSDLEQPMVGVTWEEARSYCESWAKGRLPTEAEWEWAVRAGSTAARYGALDAIAWYGDNSGSQRLDSTRAWEKDSVQDGTKYSKIIEKNGNRIHPVKQKQPNAWGLYDMLGSVWEWVADWYQEDYYRNLPSTAIDPKGPPSGTMRVLRGGSWFNNPRYVRASYRNWKAPENRSSNFGFRCAREVIP